MANHFVIVGRVMTADTHENFTSVTLAVEEELISFSLKGVLEESFIRECTVGDLLGAKGRLMSNKEIQVEKITYLSAKTNKED